MDHVLHRIDQLPAQQVQRRPTVEFDVVKRVREDLRAPHEAGQHALLQAQLHRAEQQRAQAEGEPDLTDVAYEAGMAVRRGKDAEQRRMQPQNQG